jgi:hypothetical protein
MAPQGNFFDANHLIFTPDFVKSLKMLLLNMWKFSNQS